MNQTKNYGYVRSLDDLSRLADRMGETDDPIGFDIETGYHGPPRVKASLMPHATSFVVGFSMTTDPRWARYVPLRHDFGPNLDAGKAFAIVKPLLEQRRIVAHNAKFEKRNMRNEGIELGILADTMIEAYVLSEWRSPGLKSLVRDIFDHQMTEIHELFPDLAVKDRDTLRFNIVEVNPDTVAYACEDAAWCLALHERNAERVAKERKFIHGVEMAIVEQMCDVEDRGVAADWEGMARARAKADPFIAKFEAEVKADLGAMVGRSLATMSLNSSKQMRELLYAPRPDGLGLKTTRMTTGGKPSTDAVAMAKLAKDYPAVQKILQLREVQNLRNRLDLWLEADKFKPPVQGRDGRVHAGYAQAIVGTGRFAANDPPIQQCPKDWRWELADGTAFEGNFRNFIVAAPGHYLLGFDYSQIELRVLAGLSQEPALLDAFNNDKDVHAITAAMMLGKDPEHVDPKIERPIGKTMNFALMYGMGAQSLGERLAISKERANELYAAYFAGFPSITDWMAKMKREGEQLQYTISKFGRKYTVWELRSSNKAIYSKGERVLINAPVQGGAADYVKIAMLRVEQTLRRLGWWNDAVRLVMNQHDALTFEVRNDLDPREVIRALRPRVEFAVEGFPKIVSEWEFGTRWGSCVPVDENTEVLRDPDGTPSSDPRKGPTREDDDLAPATQISTTLLDTVETPPRDEPDPEDPYDQEEEARPIPTGRALVVEIGEMPDQDQYDRFRKWVTNHPGGNAVTLRTPEGELPLAALTSLTLADQPQMSTIFSGARVYYPPGEVSAEAMRMDMTL